MRLDLTPMSPYLCRVLQLSGIAYVGYCECRVRQMSVWQMSGMSNVWYVKWGYENVVMGSGVKVNGGHRLKALQFLKKILEYKFSIAGRVKLH